MPKKKQWEMHIPVNKDHPDQSLFKTTKVYKGKRRQKKTKIWQKRKKSLT